MRDKAKSALSSNQLATLLKEHELKRLDDQKQIQVQRLIIAQKQAKLEQFNIQLKSKALARKVSQIRQKHFIDRQQAELKLLHQQINQKRLQAYFEQEQNKKDSLIRQSKFFYGFSFLLFVISGLVLLLYVQQLSKQKTKTELQLAETRNEANARIIQTQEAERKRLAADLHDDLGGTLATLSRRLSDIRRSLHESEQIQSIDDLQPLMQKCTKDLRRIAHNLMPPEFELFGLRYALEHLIESQSGQDTRFLFIVTGSERRLSLDTELNIYRIVSELVQNILKHAKAMRATVQLLYYEDQLCITVEDDGLGSSVEKSSTGRDGIGLKTSNLRAEYIGATLWRDASKSGTLVVLTIPYYT